jgi:hypothetical protein
MSHENAAMKDYYTHSKREDSKENISEEEGAWFLWKNFAFLGARVPEF